MTPSEFSEHKERDVVLVLHHRHVGVMNARFLRTPNARSILQRCKIFARGLQWGPEATRLRSRLRMRSACHAKPRNGARLRAALAIFFGKANRLFTFTGIGYLAVQHIVLRIGWPAVGAIAYCVLRIAYSIAYIAYVLVGKLPLVPPHTV